MFVGSVPRPVVDQILRTVDFGAWGGVFVCCSGSFRVDRAIKAKWPDARLISNDVSLYSVSLGRLVTNEPFSIRFTGRLAFIEQAVDVDDFEGRVAAVLVAHEMATYRGTNVWAQAHFRHYVDGFGDYLAGAKAKLCTFRERMRIDGFTARDFRYHADVATGSDGVVAFPPTYRGGYERMYRFVDDNTEWNRPAYDVWDPNDLDEWVHGLRDRGTPYRGGPRNSDRLLRWDPDQEEGVWNATEETELSC